MSAGGTRRPHIPWGTIMALLGGLATLLGIIGFFLIALPSILGRRGAEQREAAEATAAAERQEALFATLAYLQSQSSDAALQLTQIAVAEQQAANEQTQQAVAAQQAAVQATLSAIQGAQDVVLATNNAIAAATQTADAANAAATQAAQDATSTAHANTHAGDGQRLPADRGRQRGADHRPKPGWRAAGSPRPRRRRWGTELTV